MQAADCASQWLCTTGQPSPHDVSLNDLPAVSAQVLPYLRKVFYYIGKLQLVTGIVTNYILPITVLEVRS